MEKIKHCSYIIRNFDNDVIEWGVETEKERKIREAEEIKKKRNKKIKRIYKEDLVSV